MRFTSLMVALGLALSSLSLASCMTAALAKMTPEQQTSLVNALGAAGCKGSISLGARASTAAGVSPGSAGGEFEFNGSCDPAQGRPPPSELPAGTPVPLSRLGRSSSS